MTPQTVLLGNLALGYDFAFVESEMRKDALSIYRFLSLKKERVTICRVVNSVGQEIPAERRYLETAVSTEMVAVVFKPPSP